MNKLFLVSISVAAILIPALAHAADLQPAPTAPTYYNWSGFYIGLNFGGAWDNATLTDNLTGISFKTDHNSGLVGGGQTGFNYQTGWFVWGVEADFDRASFDNAPRTLVSPVTGDTFEASANTRWITTVAGRLGVASDRWLYYAKGGGGWVENKASITDLDAGVSVSASNTNKGWLAGGGIEYAVVPNWTVRIEYDYLGLRNWTGAGGTFNVSRNVQMLTIGMNYKFDWGRY